VGVPVKSGANIDLGTPITPLSAEKRKLLQTMADEFHERFRKIVVQNRPKVDCEEKTNFDGRVFTAEQALSRGLIDSIGYLDDAIRAARHAAGAPGAQVVFYHRNNDKALSTYSITPNTPLQATLLPLSLPGVDRSKLPSFLYLWQPEPTLERLGGK
jgi:protease-4